MAHTRTSPCHLLFHPQGLPRKRGPRVAWRRCTSQVLYVGGFDCRVGYKHYASADYFVNGGRAPLPSNSFRFFEAQLGLCRAAAGQLQAYAQTASWCLRLLLAETGWFFEREDALNAKPRFVSCVETPDKFADEICSLLAVYPGRESPGHGKFSRQAFPSTRNLFAPLQGYCGHGCSVPGAHHECIARMSMRVGSMSPRMLDGAVVSASPGIRATRATLTHRSRVPHAPHICCVSASTRDVLLLAMSGCTYCRFGTI